MRSIRRGRKQFIARRRPSHRRARRQPTRRPPSFESLESRHMLTTLALRARRSIHRRRLWPVGHRRLAHSRRRRRQRAPHCLSVQQRRRHHHRTCGDRVSPFETTVIIPVDAVDDTLLDGMQTATITAQADGIDPVSAEIMVFDVETIAFDFDQLTASPGNTLTATISVSTTDRVEPFTFLFDSARPDEIASFEVTFDPSENVRVVEIPVTADAFAEGAHSVAIRVGLGVDGYLSDTDTLVLTDPGVTSSLNPVADGQARDVDMDGSVFESVATHFQEISSQAAASNGSFGESRGILEFDTSSIPTGAVIQSAVLTLDIGGAQFSPPNDQVMDVFAYAGNGIVESADANEIANPIGQLVVPTDEGWILGSYAIPLDIAAIQSLVASGDNLGIVTTMQAHRLTFYSKEFFRTSSRPALHLVYSYPPTLTANSLTLGEGEALTLTAANIAATDADTADDAITFSVSSVTGGEFLVAGNPATSFTQAQVLAGQVAFAHDGGEAAPAFSITVSDGEVSDGPHATSINFTSVNDNAPVVPGGQAFSLIETATTGTAVGTVTFSDADLPADSLTVSIAAGNTGGVFGIDNAGQLTVANNANLDYETTPSYTLTIRVFDGVHTTDQTVTVNVVDVSETKFYVVNDGSSDRTYEYGPTGSAIENYSIPIGNSSPMGAATPPPATACGSSITTARSSSTTTTADCSVRGRPTRCPSPPPPKESPPTAPISGSSITSPTKSTSTPAPPAAFRARNPQPAASISTVTIPHPRTSSPTAPRSGSSTAPQTTKCSSTRWPVACSAAGRSAPPIPSPPASPSTRRTSATSGSSIAAPTVSIDMRAQPVARPAASRRPPPLRSPQATRIHKASPIRPFHCQHPKSTNRCAALRPIAPTHDSNRLRSVNQLRTRSRRSGSPANRSLIRMPMTVSKWIC